MAPPQEFNIMGMVLTSMKHRVCPQAWAYLKSEGHSPPTESAAYSLLVALYEKGRTDKIGTILLGKLKGILGGEEMSVQSGADRQKKIDELMSELQCRRRLGAVRDEVGKHLTQPTQIASAPTEHWEGVSRHKVMSVEDCTAFLQSLPLPANFKAMTKALFIPLTQELVDEALKRLHNDVSPSDDGVGARIYKRFSEAFSPAMFQIAEHCFTKGCFYDNWGVGIINSIPKVSGTCVIAKLRPIALHAVKKNGP